MADSQVLKALLPDNPLCGISTYKDTLNLATGACTRQIKKLVLDGSETWYINNAGTVNTFFSMTLANPLNVNLGISTHFEFKGIYTSNTDVGFYVTTSGDLRIRPDNVSSMTKSDFTTWLSQQNANGTPVTVWYVLATATTETITVPTGLSGTVEGYLNQDGTPTPTNPIYPTANNVEIWQHSLRKLTTATEAVENPLYSDGTAITAYTIKGNEEHTGTPTPSNPVTVQGVGNKTANLFDKNNIADIDGYIATNKVILATGVKSLLVPCQPNTTYTVSRQYKTKRFYIGFITSSQVVNNMPVTNVTGDNGATSLTSTSGNDSQYLIIFYAKTEGTDSNTAAEIEQFINGLMVNTGSTAKPFEPYGYKIPISSGGVTTNIYLTEQLMKSKDGTVNDNIASDGTVTYNLVKKVYDGSESWIKESGDSNRSVFRQPIAGLPVVGYCTHIEWKSSYASSEYNKVIVNDNQVLYISIENSVIGGTQSSTDFTSWLTNQYNNGTPFTLYYIAATPTTTQITMPSIPTTEGANSITVDTTVQPSEFTATWTGWHDASVKEKSRNLFDATWEQNGIDNSGNPTTSSARVRAYVDVEPNTEYTFSSNEYVRLIYGYNGTTKVGVIYDVPFNTTKSYTFTTGATVNRLGIVLMNSKYSQDATDIVPTDVQETMLNTGSTALPYEPYWE